MQKHVERFEPEYLNVCVFKDNDCAIFPLRASHWATVKADVENDQFIGELNTQGYTSHVASLWILEGLLVYIQPENVTKILKVNKFGKL